MLKATMTAVVIAIGLTAPPAGAQAPFMPAPVLSDPAPSGARINQAGVIGNYYPASGEGPRPTVLLLGGSEGGLGLGATRMAKALQASGFDVLHLSFFGAPGQPRQLVDVPLETFAKAVAWLRARPGGRGAGPVAMVGGSKGAEAALLVASRLPAIKAVVAGMPSSVVWPGISYTPEMKASWTADGRPLPFLPYVFGSAYRNIYGAYDNGLKTLAAHPDAAIPVERIAGPVMLVCGKADTLWPSCPMAEQIVARLKSKSFRPRVELLEYDNAGHAVFGPPVESSNPAYPTLGSLGGAAEGNNAARRDNWARALVFLHAALGG